MYKSKQIIVNKSAISYLDEGRGPIILFVHGWLDSKETFHNLINELKLQYRCIAIDLPNFGASQVDKSVASVDTYASFLQDFLDKLDIKKYVVAGHSMGGQIALYAVGKNIIKPTALVLIASSGVRNNNNLSKQLVKKISFVLRRFIPEKTKNSIYKKIGSDYSTKLSSVHKIIIKNMLQKDVQNEAKKIVTPTLLIYGDSDKHTPVSMGKSLSSAIQSSKLKVLSGADHWLHQSNAKIIADLIRKMNK
jgi:pimeloyl-ACP methyl ester carboxylesterase